MHLYIIFHCPREGITGDLSGRRYQCEPFIYGPYSIGCWVCAFQGTTPRSGVAACFNAVNEKPLLISVGVAFHLCLMRLNEAIDLVFVQGGGLREKADTIRGYENNARLFCLYAHNPEIELVTAPQIEIYLKENEEIGFKRNSLIHRAAALRRLFRSLKRRGYKVLDPDDIIIPKKEFRQPRVATDEQIGKVLELLPADSIDLKTIRNRAMLLFLRDTGMRVGEMVSINLKDIDLDSKRTLIKTEKSRGMRPVRGAFWYDECGEALNQWLKVRAKMMKTIRGLGDPGALFVSVNGWQSGYRLTNSGVEIAFRKLSKAACVPTLNPHSLRHRKGHILAQSGANNSIISGVLGHSSLSSSYVYTMLNDRELEDMARRFGGEQSPPEVLKS